jgi:ABC-2 type transport system ATP-binding protein
MQTLECRGVSKKYSKEKFALKDVNLSIPAKGIFALIGRNGAGKTTLVRILATELLPSEGTASIDGLDILKHPKAVRERIAIVPQEARTVPWLTPREQVYTYLLWRGFSMAEARKRAARSLKKLHLEEYADKQNRFLSGGIKRKVLVSTVLASEADIIFLDEPTTGLDPISRAELWKVLAKLKKDHFIFLTTHYLEEAERLADRLAILENGLLMKQGTLQELRNSIKYSYSIKLLDGSSKIKPRIGEVIKGLDGSTQIITTEKYAYELTKKLVEKRIRFSMNPISLDDIFYYIVKKPLSAEDYQESGEEEDW